MSQKQNLNKAIRRLQRDQNLTRTGALQTLAVKYRVSYATLHTLAKHGKMPTRRNSVDAILNIIKEN